MARLILRLALEILFCYAVVTTLVYVFQRHLQYFPDPTPPGLPANSGVPEMKPVHVTTADGLTLAAWFAPPKHKDGRIIVFFHGNAGTIALRADKAGLFLKHGYGVYLCEYRGYGGNPGKPDEQGFYADGRAALAWLEAQGYSPKQFVLYGESLGSGVAVQMALEMQPRMLMIEFGFSSAADIAKRNYPVLPVDLLMKDRYDNADKIGEVKAALLVMHGDADPVIPLVYGRKLFDAAKTPDKHMIVVAGGGHVNLYENFNIGPAVLKWLDAEVRADDKK